nr:MAG: protein of unknown function DUF1737 [Bacteriophage sp.]
MTQLILISSADTSTLENEIRSYILLGWRPVGSMVKNGSSWYFQLASDGSPSAQFSIVNESEDWRFSNQASVLMSQGLEPMGPLIVDSGKFIQAFSDSEDIDIVDISQVTGLSNFGLQACTQSGIFAYDILDSTDYGRSIMRGDSTPIEGLSGTSTFGQSVLTANGVTSEQIIDSTPFGRSILTGTSIPTEPQE